MASLFSRKSLFLNIFFARYSSLVSIDIFLHHSPVKLGIILSHIHITKNQSLLKLYTKMNGHEKNSSGSGTCTPVPLEQVTEQITKDFVSSSREPTPEGTPPDKVIRTPPHFSPRSDLLNQKPTKENAQSLFSQDCCVFVGK
jgi:hypothetical protein